MKIGIYTIIAQNYGAQLQAYATARYLQRICKGQTVELVQIKRELKGLSNWKRIIKSLFPKEFVRQYRFKKFQSLSAFTKSYTNKELINAPLLYDMHIVGSDQVWNVSKGFDNHLIYFLPFRTSAPKIALASSFGASDIPQNFKPKVSEFLKDFNSISVRETDGVKILSGMGIEAQEILDPTFWLDKSEWVQLAGDKPIIQRDYIFAFGFEISNQEPQMFMDCVKEIYGLPVVGLITYRKFHYDKRCETYGPLEFINIIKYAKLVITSSFHTMVFSLMFQKDFYLLKHSTRNSRMAGILEKLNLSDRMIDGREPESYKKTIQKREKIDYEIVNPLIKTMQDKTRSYIENVISKYL